MADKVKYGKERLFDVLKTISQEVDSKAYLIGGLAMIHHGLKLATKDVDVVFETEDEAVSFEDQMVRLGFTKPLSLQKEYQELGAHRILESDKNCRFDIFVKTVCRALVLSEGMRSRAKRIELPGKMQLLAISPEDIFLFKGVTARPDDLADMSLIAGRGLDWNVIESELRTQPDNWKWLLRVYMRLLELDEEYGVSSPLIGRFEHESEVYAGVGLIYYRLEKKPLTILEIVGMLEDDTDFAKEVMTKMTELGLVKEENGIFSLIEK